MKTIIRKTTIAVSLILALTASSFKAHAQNDKFVYRRSTNPSIGITIPNATGAPFIIKDKKGNIVYSGTVKSDKTFYIPTGKLGTGTFCFFIGSFALQEFQVK
jgi:hypothetical protein